LWISGISDMSTIAKRSKRGDKVDMDGGGCREKKEAEASGGEGMKR
jgi:hypothetical protein